MYSYIYHPITNKKININSINGKELLKRYIYQIGGVKNNCNNKNKKKEPKCESLPGCKWIPKKGCKKIDTIASPKKTSKLIKPSSIVKEKSKLKSKLKLKKKKKKKKKGKKTPVDDNIIEITVDGKLKTYKKAQKKMSDGRSVLHTMGLMNRIKGFRHNMKFKFTKEILNNFIDKDPYYKIIREYLREIMDTEIILGSRPDYARPYINPSICNSYKKTKDPQCDDQELCEWGDKGKWRGIGCKISPEKLAKRNTTFPWYEGWRDDTTDVLTKAYNRSYYTSMDVDIIPQWQKNYNASRWKNNKGYDVWNWGHLLYNNKISGVSVEFKSGKKNTKNTYKHLYTTVKSYLESSLPHYRYLNKTDLYNKLKNTTINALKYNNFDTNDGLKYEPIPYKFAETPEGSPFADPSKSNLDHLDCWVKYKLHNNKIKGGPLIMIVWGSRNADTIKEEYIEVCE